MPEVPIADQAKLLKRLVLLSADETLIALDSKTTVDELKNFVNSEDVTIFIAANQNTMDSLERNNPQIRRSINNCPLSIIDNIAEGFYSLDDLDTNTEDKLGLILAQIDGLRRDLAEVFSELKLGNVAAVTSAEYDQRSREQLAARVARLEERDRQGKPSLSK